MIAVASRPESTTMVSDQYDFAVIGHLENWSHIFDYIRRTTNKPVNEPEMQKMYTYIPPRRLFRMSTGTLSSGKTVRGAYIESFISPDELDIKFARKNLNKVKQAAVVAQKLGAKVVSLGGFSSILIEGNVNLLGDLQTTQFTTGNSLTVALIAKGVLRACALRNVVLERSKVLVIGSTGDVGSGCVEYFKDKSAELLLCARERRRLTQQQETLAAAGIRCRSSTDLSELIREADVIISAASTPKPIFELAGCKAEVIVCDAGYPKNVRIADEDGSKAVFHGGMGLFTGGWLSDPGFLPEMLSFPDKGIANGCIIEGVVLAHEERFESFSVGRGRITQERIEEIWGMASRAGIALPPLYNHEGRWPSESQGPAATSDREVLEVPGGNVTTATTNLNADQTHHHHHHEYEPNLGVLLDKHPELQIDQDSYNINVTANYGEKLTAEEVFARYKAHPGADAPAHLYFHFPLCDYICHFCNYVKALLSPNADRAKSLQRWTSAMLKESQTYLDRVPWLKKARIESFYIGGGTAAILDKPYLQQILDHVRANYTLSDDCEVNLEGNPDNFYDPQRVQDALDVGFNRFSLGVQSFTPEVGRFTNRGHTVEMSLKAIANLKATGRPFNVDMMFGLPHQTPDTVTEDLRILVEAGVPTITIYRFRNAERHKMGIGNVAAWNLPKVRDKLRVQGMFPSLEVTYEMRERAVRQLLAYGYQPSPCGWWSRPGTYPDGNIPRTSRNKWQHFHSMIAYGPGAYGWLTGKDKEVIQTHNNTDVSGYLDHMESSTELPIAYGRKLTDLQAIGTALGFAFKANQPIFFKRFKDEYNVDLLVDEPFKDVFETLLAKRLMHIVEDGAAIQPTLDGEALHEEIISVYIHEKIGSFCAEVCKKV